MAEAELIDPPRGDELFDDVLVPDWIWGKAGSRSLDTVGRGVNWVLYHDASTGPREWTCEIDGSSSFSVFGGYGLEVTGREGQDLFGSPSQ